MNNEDIHNNPPSNGITKITDDNYHLLFPKFFTPIIEDTEDGGKLITWKLKKGPSYVQGWVHLQPPKKSWSRKPIMPMNTYTMSSSNLTKIHEFMDKYIHYTEDSPTKVRQYFVNMSRELVKNGGSY
jgi:hypothetical protein